MAAKFFNRATVRGEVASLNEIEFERKSGPNKGTKGKFLTITVNTGNGNRVDVQVFPTTKDPKKVDVIQEQFPVGSLIEASGKVQEQEYETEGGGKRIARRVSAFRVSDLADASRKNATFIIHGIVEHVREVSDDDFEVVVRVDETYTDREDVTHTRSEEFTLRVRQDIVNADELEAGCNARFKGRILNQVIYDEYDDIIGSTQELRAEKVENVVSADDLEDDEKEELPFDLD